MDMSHTLNDVAIRIKQRRNELGLSLQDVANITGMSKSTLQRYESGGIRNLPIQKLDTLSRALQTTQEWLIKGGETPLSITLSEIMEDKNISPDDLATSLNIPKEAIKEWLSGNTAPKYEDFPQICKALGISDFELTKSDSISEDIAAKVIYRLYNPYEEQYPTVIKDAASSLMYSLQPLVNRLSEENPDNIIPATNCLADIGNSIIDLLKAFSVREKTNNVQEFRFDI